MPWALKPRMFTWEANAKSPTFLGICGAENQIGCVLRPGIWPKPWKTIGRSTGTLEANSPPRVSSGHSAIGDVAAKTEAPTFTNDIVRSSCKLQIAAGGKPEGEEFREKRAPHLDPKSTRPYYSH